MSTRTEDRYTFPPYPLAGARQAKREGLQDAWKRHQAFMAATTPDALAAFLRACGDESATDHDAEPRNSAGQPS